MLLKLTSWCIFSAIILYIAGWDIGTAHVFGAESMLLEENGFYFRIGQSWFGAEFHPRFFDSPFISWIALGAVTGFVIIPLF